MRASSKCAHQCDHFRVLSLHVFDISFRPAKLRQMQNKSRESLESRVGKREKRIKIQQMLMLALHRITTQQSRETFASGEWLLKRIDPVGAKRRWKPSYRIHQALSRLEKKGLVMTVRTAKGPNALLTEKGKRYAQRLHASEQIRIRPPHKWDKQWRIVIFDIWERRRKVRYHLRTALKKAGFLRLQDSVWIYPYDCEELLAFLRADLNLGKSILYIIANGIEREGYLKKHFGLE